jgi:RNA polymerase sigma-70 factor (ECF subfamily)
MRAKTANSEALSRQLAEDRFARLYAEHGRELLAYALRRAPAPEDAADAVAEAFLVAWRRGPEVPAGPEARLWLYGVARHTLANQRRGERRRARLAERLRAELAIAAAAQPAPGAEAAPILRALERLDENDRELLLLVGWEELTPSEAARVLDLTAVAVRSRLHRARRRLRRALAEVEEGTGARGADGKLECEEAA